MARPLLAHPWRRMMLAATLMMALAGQLVPSGIMPTMAGDGVLRMTICADSALSNHEMVLTEAGNLIPADAHDAGDDGARADGFCPFAAASLAVPHDPAFTVADVAVLGLVPAAPSITAGAMGAASPLPPATGPPIIL